MKRLYAFVKYALRKTLRKLGRGTLPRKMLDFAAEESKHGDTYPRPNHKGLESSCIERGLSTYTGLPRRTTKNGFLSEDLTAKRAFRGRWSPTH